MGRDGLMEQINKDELIDKFVYELPILRARVDMTQDEVSEMAGISRQTYSALETGKRRMTWSNFMALLFIFYFNPATRGEVENSGVFSDALKKIIETNHRGLYVDGMDFKHVVSGLDGVSLETVAYDQDELRRLFDEGSVLVIGGAGDMGKLFIKTILPFRPRELYVVDIDENALAELSRDLRSSGIYMPDIYYPDPLDYSSIPFKRLYNHHKGFDVIANFASYNHINAKKDIYFVETFFKNNVFNLCDFVGLLYKFPIKAYFTIMADVSSINDVVLAASKYLAEDTLLSHVDNLPINILQGNITNKIRPDKSEIEEVIMTLKNAFNKNDTESCEIEIDIEKIILAYMADFGHSAKSDRGIYKSM